jgi:hypothetical protein
LNKRGRRPRHEAPKVWHNPDVVTGPVGGSDGARRGAGSSSRPDARSARGGADGAPHPGEVTRRSVDAASRRGDPGRRGDDGAVATAPTERAPHRAQRIVTVSAGPTDPAILELERLVARLTAAEGRPAITRAADAILAAGHALPDDDQSVQLQLLEHSKEDYVERALSNLARILAAEPCKRPTVLQSRLRRLEQFADEPTTREAARRLWRQVTGRSSAEGPTPTPPKVAVDAAPPATLGPETLRSETE